MSNPIGFFRTAMLDKYRCIITTFPITTIAKRRPIAFLLVMAAKLNKHCSKKG